MSEFESPIAIALRPRVFSRIVGQDMAVRLLQQMVAKKYTPRCVLISGPSGNGKTTMARIYAALLNCDDRQGLEPCGKCDNCVSIFASNSGLVYEMEAATHRKVDDMDDIRRLVEYAVPEGKRRVVIVDEFHAISDTAQESLLHVLESYANNTTFVLTTTEPRKIKDAVLSRAFPINLGPIGASDRANLVERYFNENSIQAEAGVASVVVRASYGMRSVWQLVDKLRVGAESGQPITCEYAQAVLGVVTGKKLEVIASSVKESLMRLNGNCLDAQKSGCDWATFMEILFRLAEDFIVLHESGEVRNTSGVSDQFLKSGIWTKSDSLKLVSEYSRLLRLDWKSGVPSLYALFIRVEATQPLVMAGSTPTPASVSGPSKAELLNNDPVWVRVGQKIGMRVVEAA